MKITRKRIKNVNEKVTDANVINQKMDYSIRYRNVKSDRFIYLDETGLNLLSLKNYGYSPANSSINIAVPVRNKNVSSLVLISNSCILHYKIVELEIDSLLFLKFFEECL